MIGAVRRELPDRLLIAVEHHLRQVLTEYLRAVGVYVGTPVGERIGDLVFVAEPVDEVRQFLMVMLDSARRGARVPLLVRWLPAGHRHHARSPRGAGRR